MRLSSSACRPSMAKGSRPRGVTSIAAYIGGSLMQSSESYRAIRRSRIERGIPTVDHWQDNRHGLSDHAFELLQMMEMLLTKNRK